MSDAVKTESRKKDHVDIVLERNVQYSHSAGFDAYSFVHNALPELSYDEINLSTIFLKKKISLPLMIIGMTGGYKDAERINRALAERAEEKNIIFAVGSQRAMIENPDLKKTYYVRDVAPSIPIVGNIGGVQLTRYPFEKIESMVSAIEADALAIHLNPLQEMVQPEGDRDFRGILKAIEKTCDKLSVPVIVKETGAGISKSVCKKLKAAGAAYVDVSGSGGTSWSKVEYERNGKIVGFENWGIPTTQALIQCKGIVPLIASGGIRSGIDAAKSLALGADIAGAAYPFLKALETGDTKLVTLDLWEQQLKTVCVLTGSKTLKDLQKQELVKN